MRLVVGSVQPGRGGGRVRFVEGPIELPAHLAPGGDDSILCARSGRARSAGPPSSPLPARGVVLLDPSLDRRSSAPGPVVAGVPEGLLVPEDAVELDGNAGALELPEVQEIPVVTSFLQREDGRILLLRRSEKVGSFQGRWAAVSGYLESDDPLERAITEIREETGIEPASVRLLTRGSPVYARDRARVYTIHPFRFAVGHPEVMLDWEHTEARWVAPHEVAQYETVPRLEETWAKVAHPGPVRRA